MSEQYEPELGQMCFGQPWQELEAPDYLVDALCMLAEPIREKLNEGITATHRIYEASSPMENSGQRFDCEVFQAHAYAWDEEEEQEFNFAWRDLRVSWYKHVRRGTTVNRPVSRREVVVMLSECLGALEGE